MGSSMGSWISPHFFSVGKASLSPQPCFSPPARWDSRMTKYTHLFFWCGLWLGHNSRPDCHRKARTFEHRRPVFMDVSWWPPKEQKMPFVGLTQRFPCTQFPAEASITFPDNKKEKKKRLNSEIKLSIFKVKITPCSRVMERGGKVRRWYSDAVSVAWGP